MRAHSIWISTVTIALLSLSAACSDDGNEDPDADGLQIDAALADGAPDKADAATTDGPTLDADTTDAPIGSPDAALDAATNPDATVPIPDGGSPSTDATPPAPDADPPAPDGAVPPTPDATVPAPDATVPAPDAAVHTPDAAVPVADAAVIVPDAAAPDATPLPTCTVPAQVTIAANGLNSAVLFLPAEPPQFPNDEHIWNYVTGQGQQGVDDFYNFDLLSPVQIGTPIDMGDGCQNGSKFCWVVLGDYTVDGSGSLGGDVYFALDGTMTITAAGPIGGHFTASFSGVRFFHFVPAAGGGFVPAPDGCTASVANGTVDLIVQAPGGKSNVKTKRTPKRVIR